MRKIAIFFLALTVATPVVGQSRPSGTTTPRKPPAMSRAVRDSMIWRRDELLTRFEFEEDRIDGGGWYRHRNLTVRRTYNRSALKAAISATGRIYLISQYHGSGWIFHEQLAVRIGPRVLRSAPVPGHSDLNERDASGSGVWETIHFTGDRDNGILAAIARAKPDDEIIVRQVGRQNFNEFTLNIYDQRALAQSVELARLLRTVGRTPQASRERPRFVAHKETRRYFLRTATCSDSATINSSPLSLLSTEFDALDEEYQRADETTCRSLLDSLATADILQRQAKAKADSAAAADRDARQAAEERQRMFADLLRAAARARDDSIAAAAAARRDSSNAGFNIIIGPVHADRRTMKYFRPGCRDDQRKGLVRIRYPSSEAAVHDGFVRSPTRGC